MSAPLQSWRPELLDARDFRGIPGTFGQSSGDSFQALGRGRRKSARAPLVRIEELLEHRSEGGFAERGHTVLLGAHDLERGRAVARELQGGVRALKIDVTMTSFIAHAYCARRDVEA